jgi:hypothetical protein
MLPAGPAFFGESRSWELGVRINSRSRVLEKPESLGLLDFILALFLSKHLF